MGGLRGPRNADALRQLTELAAEAPEGALPCQGADGGLWLSESVADQRVAARRCARCPLLTLCRRGGRGEKAGGWGGVARGTQAKSTTEVAAA